MGFTDLTIGTRFRFECDGTTAGNLYEKTSSDGYVRVSDPSQTVFVPSLFHQRSQDGFNTSFNHCQPEGR